MFLGHFAVGLAAKRAAPRASLGTCFAAAQLLDILWPTLVLLGVETVRIDPGNTPVTPFDFTSNPYSHSLVAAVGWSVLLGAGYGLLRRDARGALVLGLAVASHWLLDYVSHRPDMPLDLGARTRVGLGLWYSLPATLAVELALFAAGIALYLGGTRAKDRTGRIAFWTLIAFLLLGYGGAVFGPPPPSVAVIAWSGEGIWLLVLWAAWADRHRVHTAVRTGSRAAC